MTVDLKHSTVATLPDQVGVEINKAEWNAAHLLTQATGKLLGRATAGDGATEEITLGTNLSFTGTTLNAAGGGGGGVTDVTATAPVTSTGGTTPVIAMAAADASTDGYLKKGDWTTFNSKGSGTVTQVSVTTANGISGTVATDTTTPAITLVLGDINPNDLIVGDPGTEGANIKVNGLTYTSRFKVSDMDGTNAAQSILHKHSTTVEPILVTARSNSDTSAHGDVTAGMPLFSMFATGWTGASYKIAGGIVCSVDTSGVVSSTSMPGRWSFQVTPTGAIWPVDAFLVKQDKAVQFLGNASVDGTFSIAAASTGVLHATAGAVSASAVTEADISLSAVSTNNVTTARHGFCPVLPNVATQFLNGQGNYTVPSGLTISASYSATSFSGQTSVSVTHNFGTYPLVQVIDNAGAMLIPLTIVNNTINDFTVTFATSTTGTIMASVGSPQPQAVTTIAATPYTVLTADRIVTVTASNAVITLPTAVGNTGREFNIDNASSTNITVGTTSSQTIQGQLTQTLPPNSAMTVYSNGANWRII